MTCSTPSFALQTLGENAVRHSIATRAEGGRIEITARMGATDLHLRVWDDGGIGLPATQDGSHFGLHALHAGLQARDVDAASLEIESDRAGFEVSCGVPRTGSRARVYD